MAQGAVIIFNKHKSQERKRKIFFVDASKEFEQHPEIRKLNRLGLDNLKRIVELCSHLKEEKGVSRVVSLDKIISKDFSLNVPLYILQEDETETISLSKEFAELREIEEEESKLSINLENTFLK